MLGLRLPPSQRMELWFSLLNCFVHLYQVLSCFQSVKDGLVAGACAEMYKEHLACVEQVGWRESVKDCKISREQVQECSVRAGLGELSTA